MGGMRVGPPEAARDGDRIPTVVMYSRRTCGLCEEARKVLLGEQRSIPFRFEEIFIDGDDRLELEYGVRVPVVEIEGVKRFEYAVDPWRLRGLLREARAAPRKPG
jgi:glutaredoxin